MLRRNIHPKAEYKIKNTIHETYQATSCFILKKHMVNSYTATVLPKSGSGLLNKTCLAY